MSGFLGKLKKILVSDCAAIIYISMIMCLITEILGHKNPMDGFINTFIHPHVFLFNTLLIAITMSVALYFKRRIFVCSVITVLWLILAIANCILLHLRGYPLTVVDFTIFNYGIEVMPAYLSPLNILLIIAAFVAAAVIMSVLFMKGKKYPVHPVRSTAFIVGVIALSVALFFTYLGTGVISRKYDNIIDSYSEDGFAYCFALSAFDTGIDQPDDYSKKSVDELLEILAPEGTTPEATPNIIFYQLESFFDPSRLKNITTSEDPIPNFTALKNAGTGGTLKVTTIGGGTANTEFEVLTGIDLALFGLGEYPYATVLKESSCSTICYDLEPYGYTSHALHNHAGSFYGRNDVFGRLGFDTFTSVEYMQGEIDRTPADWAKDYVLLDGIKASLESTEGPDFIFAISVEGHGKYPSNVAWPGGNITVEGAGELDDEFEYYVNVINDMDKVLGELIEYVDSLDEPTLLVAYGDHLPALELDDDDLTDGDIYLSEYVMYSNCDLDKESFGDIEAYQLYPKVFNSLGIEGSVVCRLNNRLDSEAGFSEAMQTIAYDILYGERKSVGGSSPVKQHPLKMGIEDIVIENVYAEDGKLHVIGRNFTEFSTIYIGMWRQETTFIDSGHLVCDDNWAFLSNSLYVAQISAGNEKLSVTADYNIDDIN